MSLTLTLPAIYTPLYSEFTELLLSDLPSRRLLTSLHPFAIAFQVARSSARAPLNVGGHRHFLTWNSPRLTAVDFGSLSASARNGAASQMLALIDDRDLGRAIQAAISSETQSNDEDLWTVACRPHAAILIRNQPIKAEPQCGPNQFRRVIEDRYRVLLCSNISQHASIEAMEDAACLIERHLKSDVQLAARMVEMSHRSLDGVQVNVTGSSTRELA